MSKVKDYGAIPTADDSSVPLGDHLIEQSESVNWITLPRNEYSAKADILPGLITSLQERMWRLINTLNDFCRAIFEICKDETFIQAFISDFDILKTEFNSVKEIYENSSPTVHINSNINEDKQDLVDHAQNDMPSTSTMITDEHLSVSLFKTNENISAIKTNSPSVQKIPPIVKCNLNRILNKLDHRKFKKSSTSAVMKSSVTPLMENPQLNGSINVQDCIGTSTLTSLKQRMWDLITKLVEYCAFLSQAIPAEKSLSDNFDEIYEEFESIKEMYLQQDKISKKAQNFDKPTNSNKSKNNVLNICGTPTTTVDKNVDAVVTINTTEICETKSKISPQVPAHASESLLSAVVGQLNTNTRKSTAKEQALEMRQERINRHRNYYMKFKFNHEKFGECYNCAVCNKVFKKWYLLRHHDQVHIKTAYKVQCEVCKKFVTGYNIKYHTQNHQNNRNHECDVCGAKFLQLGHLKKHVAQITACTFPSFQCNICEEKFNKEEEYGNHFKEKHLNKKMICDLCGDEVCEKCVEDKHQVTLLKLYKCKFCEESFTFKKEYKTHLRAIHSSLHPSPLLKQLQGYDKKNNNSFLCEYCSKYFSSKRSLENHCRKKHMK